MIGIIGGAGVAATNKLLEIIEVELTEKGAFRDCHHPEMIIMQATQAPSRSMFLEGKGLSFVSDYVNVAKKLKQAGATKLCMCCNTAHYAISEIEEKSDVRFINLIENVVKAAKESEKKHIGLIASDGCLKGSVYEKVLNSIFSEATIIYPDTKNQSEVTRGICNIKNNSRFLSRNHPDRPYNIFKNIYNHLLEKGADLVIVGCTDIRVDFKVPKSIDSLEVLAQSIIKNS